MKNSQISLFKSCTSITPITVLTIEELFTTISDQRHKEKIQAYWDILATCNKEKISAFKKNNLTTVTYTAVFSQRKNDCLIKPSGIIVIDIDDCQNLEKLKEQLSADKFTLAVTDSPSLTGLKLFVKMNFGYDAQQYKVLYMNVVSYYSEEYNIPLVDKRKSGTANWGIDTSCSDISRQLIIPYDNNFTVNYNSDTFDHFKTFSTNELKLQNILKQINANQIDITPTYDNYFKIGCALNNFLGEAGRIYYHNLCKYHAEYDEQRCDKQYDSIIESGSKGITIATLFSIANDYGISLNNIVSNRQNAEVTITEDLEEESFTIPIIPFPQHIFPIELSVFITEATKALDCTIDMLALPILTVIGVAIGNTRFLRIKNGYEEYSNLFVAIVAEPGSKKTAILKTVIRPLQNIQSKYQDAYNQLMKIYTEELKVYREAKENSKKNKNVVVPDEPIKPNMQRIILDDATMEAVADILHKNNKGVILVKDELSGWVKSMNMYRGKGNDLEKWLSLWSKAMLIVDRKGTDPMIIKNPFISVIGCMVKDAFKEFIRGGKDGFIDRILFVFPDPKLIEVNDFEISNASLNNYSKFITDIDKLKFSKDEEPIEIKMSENARKLVRKWREQHASEMNNHLLPYYLKSVWSKLESHFFRIILIIHIMHTKTECDVEVQAYIIEKAVEVITYIKGQASKVHGLINSSEEDLKITEIIAHVKRCGGKCKATEIYKHNIAGCRTSEAAKKIFEIMERRELGKIQIVTNSKGSRASTIFILN